MKKHWFLPLLVLLAGIALLAFQNYTEASTPPSDSWSREAEIGTTPIRSAMDGIHTEEGTYTIASFTSDALVVRTFDEELSNIEEKEVPVPVTKGAQVYTGKDHTLYFSGNAIYESDAEKELTAADRFYPLDSGIVYVNEETVYFMDGETLTTTKITENVRETSSVHSYEKEEEIITAVSVPDDNEVTSVLYRTKEGESTKISNIEASLSPSLKLKEAYPILTDGKSQLLISAVPAFQRKTTGSESFFLTSAESDSLKEMSFSDPKTQEELEEINDITVIAKEKSTALLFRAQGFTETKTGGTEAFNVYEGIMENGTLNVTRLSNTPRLSVQPTLLADGMIAWLDEGADRNTIFLAASSAHPDFPATSLNTDTMLRTAGKTLSMLSTGLMTIFLTVMWYAPPLLMMGAWTFRRRNPFDEEKEWAFYGTIGFYTALALFFHHHLFKSQVIAGLPSFLDFTGGSFVVIVFFALLSLVIVKASDLDQWWGLPGRIAYFIGIHILFMTVFVGPYIF